MRAQRVGEASHPGPRSQNRVDADDVGPIRRVRRVPDSPSVDHVAVGRRTRRRWRLRPLPWSWSDSESDAEPFPNVVPRTDDVLPDTVPASQTALHEVGRLVCQEQVPMHDSDALVDHGQVPFPRRVVLHPESSGGTSRSVQDRSPEMSMRGNRFAALAGTETVTMPASTGSLRRVGGHQRLGADPSIADDTLLESSGPTQWESEARGHAPESDLLDAMEFDLTIRDSDPDDVPHQVPLEQRAEHPRRRLVLVGGVEEVGDSDSTATLWGGEDDGGSVVSGIEEPPSEEDILDVDVRVVQLVLREAFRLLDEVDVCQIFRRRATVMKSVPRCIRGPFRSALKLMLQEIVAGHDASDRFRVERGWKGFFMLPRLLLHRRCRGGLISKDKLKERFKLFNAGVGLNCWPPA